MDPELDENGNVIESQDSDDTNSQDEAISFFNRITNDSKDSIDDEDKGLDQEGDKTDSKVKADTQDPKADQGQVADEDPWASVPEQLRNQFNQLQTNYQALEHNHKANNGRVSALTKKLNQYEAGVKANEKANGGQDESSNLPTADDLKGKSFDEVKEEWPEVAAFVEAQVNAMEQRVSQRIDPLQQRNDSQAQDAYVQTQISMLQQAHPDYQQISGDPAFHNWVSLQGPTVHAMAQSDEAEANVTLLNLYKAQTRQQAPAPVVPAAPKKKSLSDHAELPRKGPGKAAADPDDVDPVEFFNRITSNSKK